MDFLPSQRFLHQAEPRPLPLSREKATFPSFPPFFPISCQHIPKVLNKTKTSSPSDKPLRPVEKYNLPLLLFLPDVCDTLVIKEAPSLSQTPPFLISIRAGAQP